MTKADECIAILDEKYKEWDLWRIRPDITQPQVWQVVLRIGGRGSDSNEFIVSPSLNEALSMAAEFIPLPRIPRKPTAYDRRDFEARKDGSKWTLYYRGKFFSGNIKTKRAAEGLADMMVEKSLASLEQWRDAYGLITEKRTEGVGFRWK